MQAPSSISSLYFPAPDGLRLHALDAGPRSEERLPVICLPGLARTAEDFRELIGALAFDRNNARRVIALDSRGRGLSAHDPNAANYAVPVELVDVIALLDTQAIARAVFVGTSRGGILTMTLGAVRPQAIAGAVLNDIGPVIEMAGLLRIKGYVGRLPKPASYAEAVELLKGVMGPQFPALDAASWELYARRTWRKTESGELVSWYDPAISKSLETVDPNEPFPTLWPQFDTFSTVPLMVIRGEHSDLLSPATVDAMHARRADLEVLEVAGQGHAPLLTTKETIDPIMKFVARCDA